MSIKHILIVSQVIPQWYVDLLTESIGSDSQIDIITGSNVQGNIISSPEYNSAGVKTRLISWIRHYLFVLKWMKANKKQKYDLVFAVSNPPINPYIGLKLKKRFHAPFVYMNWDLYPQVIKTTIHNPVVTAVCNMWSYWNSRNYPKIDQILTIGDVMADSMNADLKEDVSVEVIPIGVDINKLKPIKKEHNPFCVENGLTDKFVILYSGKMGLGHNIEIILEASKKLSGKKDIVFVFIGFGQKYNDIEEFIARNHPENVKLFPLQREEVFPFSMACGDIGVVTQETSMAHLFMPSKTYSMMACGEAIVGICTENDDLGIMIKANSIGEVISDSSADTMAKIILDLYENRSKTEEYKANARKTAVEKYSLSVVGSQYAKLFNRIMKPAN